MGCTCGEPNEIKKNTHPENVTALFREQAKLSRWADDLTASWARLFSKSKVVGVADFDAEVLESLDTWVVMFMMGYTP